MKLLKVRLYILFLLALLPTISISASNSNIDRSGFYAVYATTSLEGINSFIAKLENGSSSENKAFLGALFMRKSGLISNRKEQLNFFKKGRVLLEKEIEESPNNAEYRFLRITIQEQAPKILGYNKNLDQDKKVLIKGFKDLNPEAQKAIIGYAKKSHLLKNADFN